MDLTEKLRWGMTTANNLQPALQTLVESAGDTTDFVGRDLLPCEIIEAWSDLSLDAKAVAVLFAKSLSDENERMCDRHERW